MSSYKITSYTKKKAKKYGVSISHSSNKTKKLDVWKRNKKIASIGAIGYNDYPTFMNMKPNKTRSRRDVVENAKQHRRLYKMRHENNRHRKGTPGFYADKLLW